MVINEAQAKYLNTGESKNPILEKIVCPKGYKLTEVGVIPSDWNTYRISDVVDKIVGGGTPSRNIPEYWGNAIPWVTVKDFTTFNPNQAQEYISKKGLLNSSSNLIPKGVLITSTRMALGKAVIYDVDVSINQDLKAVFPKKILDTKFLYYWFQKNADLIEELGSGSTVKGISLSDLRGMIFVTPLVAEQATIAKALSDIDALIISLEKLIAKKQAIKTATMQQLLTGKKRLPGFGEGKVYKQTELGEIPEDWEIKPLGEILKIRHGKSQKEVIDDNGVYPILATGGEIGRTNIALYSKPSVLIGRKGTIDVPRYMNSPFWTVDTLFYSEINNNSDAKYIFYKFGFIDWYSYSEASGVPSLNAATIEKILQVLPSSKDEQIAISDVITNFDEDIKLLQVQLVKTQQIKQGMMQELLTGANSSN
ncbi:restriction endonuclease subunit S [Methyloprofundus sedimenti]|uniref:restriction endonuclease subunit S n=1 Tax=Methyloprofundus sedimenti TaxID=1420851 RepID=UPI0009B5FC14|nr:restriction endonuclease subunit S [Methyloprofundus sedimenti]